MPTPTILVVGAPSSGDNGAIRIFVDAGSSWVPYQTIESPAGVTGQVGAEFGADVAASGPWIAVGSPSWDRLLIGGGFIEDIGSVYLYELQEFTWLLVTVARPSEATAFDYYGSSVALHATGEGDVLMVAGAPLDEVAATDQGTAYLWRLAEGTWTVEQRLYDGLGAAEDHLGVSVAIGAYGVLAGAPNADANGLADQGVALVFNGVPLPFHDGFESGDLSAWSSYSH
jgi:hypothetical protein